MCARTRRRPSCAAENLWGTSPAHKVTSSHDSRPQTLRHLPGRVGEPHELAGVLTALAVGFGRSVLGERSPVDEELVAVRRGTSLHRLAIHVAAECSLVRGCLSSHRFSVHMRARSGVSSSTARSSVEVTLLHEGRASARRLTTRAQHILAASLVRGPQHCQIKGGGGGAGGRGHLEQDSPYIAAEECCTASKLSRRAWVSPRPEKHGMLGECWCVLEGGDRDLTLSLSEKCCVLCAGQNPKKRCVLFAGQQSHPDEYS